jgi:hypothetical protein
MELVCWPANSVAIKKPAISSSFVARPPYTFVYLMQVADLKVTTPQDASAAGTAATDWSYAPASGIRKKVSMI